mgnify:CR=1 FL=1
MNKLSSHAKTLRMVEIALLTALMLLLQLAFGSLRIGPVTLSFVLVPLVIASVFISPSAGLLIGTISGIVTFIQVLTSGDVFYTFLIATNPVATAFICVVKTALAGLLSGVVYKGVCKVSKYRSLNVILPAIICPVVNTGIFCLGMLAFFGNALQGDPTFGAAASAGLISFVFIGLAGINFIYELISNVVICPIISKALYSTKLFKVER